MSDIKNMFYRWGLPATLLIFFFGLVYLKESYDKIGGQVYTVLAPLFAATAMSLVVYELQTGKQLRRNSVKEKLDRVYSPLKLLTENKTEFQSRDNLKKIIDVGTYNHLASKELANALNKFNSEVTKNFGPNFSYMSVSVGGVTSKEDTPLPLKMLPSYFEIGSIVNKECPILEKEYGSYK